MSPAVQAGGVTGVPAVGFKKGNREAKDSKPPHTEKCDGDCCGQGSCIRTAEIGSRQPPS